MEMTVNVDNIRKFIEREEFHQFLLNNTTDFATAAWVLQTLLEACSEAEDRLATADTETEKTTDDNEG